MLHKSGHSFGGYGGRYNAHWQTASKKQKKVEACTETQSAGILWPAAGVQTSRLQEEDGNYWPIIVGTKLPERQNGYRSKKIIIVVVSVVVVVVVVVVVIVVVAAVTV
jgi:hypothetical protein